MACAHKSTGLISAGDSASRMWVVGAYERAGCSARQVLVLAPAAGAGRYAPRRQARALAVFRRECQRRPLICARAVRGQALAPARVADVKQPCCK